MNVIRLLCLALLTCATAARADLKLPAIFGDNMVLQQQMVVPVWGWAAPGATVTVKFAGQTRTAHAAADGQWLVKLGKLKASFAPQVLTITAGDTQIFTNILVGEVWLGSGQSNMEKPVGKWPGQKPVLNYEQELAAAHYPALRLFQVDEMLAATPRTNLAKFHRWQECSSNTLDSVHFSAALYFFGRELHTNLNVPVGLIHSSWGGTRIEPWTPPVGFASVPSVANIKTPDFGGKSIPNTAPSVLYNAMIAPLAGFALRGAIWYQGESNLIGARTPAAYRNYPDLMAALVNGWRQVWGEGAFPFYFVQIAPFKYFGNHGAGLSSPEELPEFWTLQARAARQIKHTGMVVTTDLVDDLNDIHPRDKAAVGHRLALLALDGTYDKEVEADSPAFEKLKITGHTAVLKFAHADGGLISRDGKPLTWFTVAGADGKFVPAEAKIVGKTVEVAAAGVAKPVAVRFAWDETAQPNLANAAGLPAEPFSTQLPVE